MKSLALSILLCDADAAKSLTVAKLLNLRREAVDPLHDKAKPKMNMFGGKAKRSSKSAGGRPKSEATRAAGQITDVTLNPSNSNADGEAAAAAMDARGRKPQRTSLISRFRSKSRDKQRKKNGKQ